MKRSYCKRSGEIALLSTAILWATLTGNSAMQSAKTVVLNYGDSSSIIALNDLKTLAETGNVPPSLEKISLILSSTQKERILAALQTQLDVNEKMGRRVLGAIASDCSCILTVTHMSQFKEAFQNRIEVWKTEGCSRLQLLT